MVLKRSISLALLFLPVVLLSSRDASACSCTNQPTVQKEYDRASVVVVTQVISIAKAQTPAAGERVLSTTMLVEKVFKGSVKFGEQMIFAQGTGADCVWMFSEKDIGQRYLLYLHGEEGAKDKGSVLWIAGICGRSRRLENAADDLLYLENISKVRGKTRLSGTLSFYQPAVLEGQEPTQGFLSGKRVRVIGDKKTYELITNQNGVYEIYDLPPGKYQVDPEIPNGWRIDYSFGSATAPQSDEGGENRAKYEVLIEAGGHAYLDFRYGANNTVRGRVLNSVGLAMDDVCVMLLPSQGNAARRFIKIGCTDDEGGFEITGVPSGSYLIVANEDGQISSNEPFRTVYYPNTFEREKAAAVNVGVGHTLEGIDITVPKTEPVTTIDGVVLFADGKPVVGEWVFFKPDETADDVEGRSIANTDGAGRFSIRILKGLIGILYSEMTIYEDEVANCVAVEKLIRDSEKTSVKLQTNAVRIREDNTTMVELRYDFPGCIKRKPRLPPVKP
jgi:hypothetical protein